jgi:FkbM family methyltransferase
MPLRIKLIQFLININEKLIFYPRLSNFYSNHVKVKKPIIFDVGANKGQTISFFLKLFPEAVIFAFEPNPRLYKMLKKKFSHLGNVKLVNKGVSNQSGKLLLKETVTDETSTFEELNYDSDYLKMKAKVLGVKPEKIVAACYEVEVITLSEFINSESLGFIDIIKIDTEGHELKCLQGLFEKSESRINYIQLEQHHDDMYLQTVKAEEIEQFLQQNAFSLSTTIKHGFGDFEELIFKRI